jgi:tubulin-specific chaperone A
MEDISSGATTENMGVLRDLKIKLGVCKRLTKEVAYYKKEAEENQNIVSQLTLAGADEWKLKQPNMCVEESYAMIPESETRLQFGIDDLYSYLIKIDDDIILSKGEGYKLKEEAEELLSKNNF